MTDDLFAQMLTNLPVTAKQKAVLRASLQLFAKQGFDQTSTHDIARLAQVSEGTVYKNYRTKRAILKAIVDPFVQRVIPKMVSDFKGQIRQQPDLPFRAYIKLIAANRFAMVNHNTMILRLIIRTLNSQAEVKQVLSQQYMLNLFADLTLVIKKYQARGEIVDLPLPEIVRLFIGTLGAYIGPVILGLQDQISVEPAAEQASLFLSKALKK